jgi:hypothetical protein
MAIGNFCPEVLFWEGCRWQSLRFLPSDGSTEVGCVFGIRTDKRPTVERSGSVPRIVGNAKVMAVRDYRCEITGVKFRAGLLNH